MSKKLFIAALLLPVMVFAMELAPGTPVFASPDLRTQPLATVTAPIQVQTLASQVCFLPRGFMTRRIVFQKIQLPNGRTAYAAPEARCLPDDHGIWRMKLLPAGQLKIGDCALLGVLALLLIIMTTFLRQKKREEQRDFLYAWLPGLGRSLILLSILMTAGGIYLFSSDEPDYFVTGLDLANGMLAHFQPRSLGTGIWYAPFVRIFHAQTVYDVLVPVSYVTGFVLSPLALALFYAFLRRFIPQKQALISMLSFAVLPLFFFRLDEFAQGIVQCFFFRPETVPGYRLYQTMTWGGFNAMSDTPAMLFLFAALAAAVRLKNARLAMVLSCGCLAIAMLFRVNSALYFPALALLWMQNRPKTADWFWAGVTGFAIFLPQLALNTIQLGNPFIFPYIRYENTANGFSFRMFGSNAKLLFVANAPFYCAGLAGLILMKNDLLRRFMLLWIGPTTIFFLGYYHFQDDATRFLLPLFAPLVAAAVTGFCNAFGRDPVKIALVGIMLLFVSPALPLGIHRTECWALPAGTGFAVTGLCICFSVWDAWKKRDWRLVPWITAYPVGGVWMPAVLFMMAAARSFAIRRKGL